MRRSLRSALHAALSCVALVACSVPSPPPASLPYTDVKLARTTPSPQDNAALLYVTDEGDNLVFVISMPSGKLVRKLAGNELPESDCSGAGGDIFVVNAIEEIRAYHHGAKSPFNVLSDAGYVPVGCSVDPVTGNLAVGNYAAQSGYGNLAIYVHAKGKAKYYEDASLSEYWYCTYDDHGDLFVDGRNASGGFAVDEIPAGKGNFTPLTLHPNIGNSSSSFPSLFWDGSYLAIASPTSGAIYQYALSGKSARRVHTTKLTGVSLVVGSFWIDRNGKGGTLYAPIVRNSITSVGVFPYPKGGRFTQDLYEAANPLSAALSLPAK